MINKLSIIFIAVCAVLCVVYGYGRARYESGYAAASLKYAQDSAAHQSQVVAAPKASRDDKEFINQVKNGEW